MPQVTIRHEGDVSYSDAASEATLEKLLSKMGGKGGGGAQGLYNDAQKKGAAELKKLSKKQKEHSEQVGVDSDATKDHTKAVDKSTSALSKFWAASKKGFGGLSSAVGGTIGGLLKGETNLANYSAGITGLINDIPVVGTMIGEPMQALISAIDQNIDSTRQLNQVGGDLGEGLFGAQLAAAEARMSLESFTALMGDQSKNLSASFGGATTGMKQFSSLMKGVKTMDKQFAALGYTVDEQAEFTAEYIELQRSQGLFSARQERKNIKGAQDYLLQLDQLTKITGLSRKEAAAALKKQADDKRLTAILHNMDEGTKAQLQAALAQVEGLSPEMGDAMKEMVATGGVPISDMGKSMMLLNPKLGEMAKGLKDGTVDQADFADEIKRTKAMAIERMKTEGDMMSAAAALGNPIYDAIFAFAKVGEVGGKLTEAQKAQAEAMKDPAKQVMNFQQVIVDLRNTIMKQLIESKIFDKVVAAVGTVVDWFGSEEGMKKVEGIIKSVTDGISGFMDKLANLDYAALWETYVKVPLENLKGLVPNWIKDMIFGKEENAEVEQSKAKVKELQTLVDEAKAAGASFVTYADGTKVALADVEKEIAATKKKIEKDEAGGGGWWQLLIDNIGKLGIIAGTTLAVGGVAYAAIMGFSLLLKLFGTGPTALGAAVLVGILVGTGAAITLAGKGIDLAGDGVQKVADALKNMSEIKDVANLKEISGIMGSMAGALAKFAVGGVIAKLMGEGTLEKLAGSLKAFEDVNASKLAQVGPGIAALYEGTSKFTGEGAWQGFSKWVGSLFGGSSNDFEKMAQGIKHFEGIDGTKLASLGSGLSGIAEFIAAISAETDLKKQVKAIEDLVDVMKDYRKQYDKMSGDMQSSFNMAVSNSGKGTIEALNELNTVIKQLVDEQRTSNEIGKKIVASVNDAGTIG